MLYVERIPVYVTSGCVLIVALLFLFSAQTRLQAQVDLSSVATTTLILSVCGDGLIDSTEQCDVPGQTGGYSTTILGRQCTELCRFDAYCGDGILQTVHGESCDDGNNTSGDFCSDICVREPLAGGGGNSNGSSGGGGGGRSTDDFGDTSVTINGKAYPNTTVNIIEDGDTIGTVKANQNGDFQFSTESRPGVTTFGFWANDNAGVRSTTFNTTFDVTQGAVTTVNSVFIPPSVRLSSQTVNSGENLTVTGQSVPNAKIIISIDNGKFIENTTADSNGRFSYVLNGTKIGTGSHTLRVKFELAQASSAAKSESTFGPLMSFGIGAPAQNTTLNTDLNRDGKVNLIDFSILIFWWGGNGGNSNPPADINKNGKVGLEDFSILLFNWTG
jgi:cysteine-rich repeat protein